MQYTDSLNKAMLLFYFILFFFFIIFWDFYRINQQAEGEIPEQRSTFCTCSVELHRLWTGILLRRELVILS